MTVKVGQVYRCVSGRYRVITLNTNAWGVECDNVARLEKLDGIYSRFWHADYSDLEKRHHYQLESEAPMTVKVGEVWTLFNGNLYQIDRIQDDHVSMTVLNEDNRKASDFVCKFDDGTYKKVYEASYPTPKFPWLTKRCERIPLGWRLVEPYEFQFNADGSYYAPEESYRFDENTATVEDKWAGDGWSAGEYDQYGGIYRILLIVKDSTPKPVVEDKRNEDPIAEETKLSRLVNAIRKAKKR